MVKPAPKVTVQTFAKAKAEHKKLSMLTCYDYSTARVIDASNVDAILVGDSLGNVILGYETTISVTLQDMIHHGAAVVRGAKRAMVVVDMPFMTYQISPEEALRNAARLMQETGATAVKLEGGVTIAPTIARLVDAGIPVMAHIGLTPQSVHALGGFRVQGKGQNAAEKLMADAMAVQNAGAFAVVLECVPHELARVVTEQLRIPTIGIGAGANCDGQVLVYQDMLGLFGDFSPKFVRRFGELGQSMRQAFDAYDQAVKAGTFPNEKECFSDASLDLERLY